MSVIKNRIYCDWGTSSLRIRLVDLSFPNDIKREILTSKGISAIHTDWVNTKGLKTHEQRISFYLAYLKPYINDLINQVFIDDQSVDVVISGMASSNIGIVELPYAELPFAINGEDAIVHFIPFSEAFNYNVLLISGVRGENEVMRGEEAQLVGVAMLNSSKENSGNTIFILPGTHSKHIYVSDNVATKIETYITGELYDILTNNGLLKDAVQPPENRPDEEEWNAFFEGIELSKDAALTHSLFRIRTNILFKKLTKQQNYLYLSGLLIGYELRSLLTKEFGALVLCSDQKLSDYYKRAIYYLGLESVTSFIDPKLAKIATIKGQGKISEQYYNYEKSKI